MERPLRFASAALLAALPSAAPAQETSVGRAIDRGREWLLQQQLLDGSWDGWASGYAGGMTALCAYTLVKSGLSPEHPAVQRALAHLRTKFPDRTYSAGSLLMLLGAVGDEENEDWAAEVAEQLDDWRRPDGTYGYPGGNADLSNALFAALGFRAAAQLGVKVPAKSWAELAEGALESYAADGGFSYGVRSGGGSGSMSAAGITILEFARDAAGRRLGGDLSRRAERASATALEWLGANWDLSRNPPARLWRFYHFYGLERVGSLLGTDTIGEHRWYEEGAEVLLKTQTAQGTWHEGNFGAGGARNLAEFEELNTCMAILFLERATATAVTGGGGGTPDLLETPGSDAPVAIRVAGRSPAVVSVVRTAQPATRARLFGRHHAQGPEEAVLLGEAESAEGRFAWRQEFGRSGRWQLWVEADTEGGLLVSPPLTVTIHDVLDEPFLGYADDSARDLLLRARRARLQASTVLDAKHAGELALDGLLGRAWRSAADDPAPWLEFELEEPVRGRRLLFTTAGNRLAEAGQPRPRALRVTVNGRREFELEMPRDARRKGVLELGRSITLRELRVEILSAWDGAPGQQPLGLAEIELQAK